MANIRWTTEEDQTIVDALKVYAVAGKPFAEAFRELPKFLENRTEGAIAYRWNNELKKKHPEVREAKRVEWTDKEDMLVANTVLKDIANGEKLIDTYEKLSKRMKNRTPEAICGRWTTVLKKKFEEGHKLALKKREVNKQLKKAVEAEEKQREQEFEAPEQMTAELSNTVVVQEPTVTVEPEIIEEEKEVDVVEQQETVHLSNFLTNITSLVEERNALKEENLSLRQQNQRLNTRCKDLQEDYNRLEEKYREVMLIMTKVQELVSEQAAGIEVMDDIKGIKLRMERNGNLIKIQ